MRGPCAIALCPLVALALAAPLAAQETPPPRAPVASQLASQLFHVVLVAAATDGGESAEALPRAVAKALADVRDYLPYQRFRIVDSALVRGSGEAHARLRGPAGTPYEVSLLFRPDGQGSGYLIERLSLRKSGGRTPPPVAAEEERALGILPPPQDELQVTFGIARGETVVVGSSRLESGDGALIVLLTAVP